MIIKEYSAFEFVFKEMLSKTQSYEHLKNLLISNDWIGSSGRKRESIKTYHSENDGHCFITLEAEVVSEDFVNLTTELYYNLVNDESIDWIKVRLSDSTEFLVDKFADYYSKIQSFNIQDMKKGDWVIVYKNKNQGHKN